MTHDDKVKAIRHVAKKAVMELMVSQDAKRHFEDAKVIDTENGFAVQWGHGRHVYFSTHEV